MGGQSWTRALLLVDKSTSRRIEITTEDCTPRVSEDSFTWRQLSDSLASLPEGDVFSGFNLTRLRSKKTKLAKGSIEKWDVVLFMKRRQDMEAIATLNLRCALGYHMDLQFLREHMSMSSFMGGQLGRHDNVSTKVMPNHAGRLFSTSADDEYHTNSSWLDLGGSSMASFYLAQGDTKGQALLAVTCQGEELRRAQALCEQQLAGRKTLVEDCVQDVCAGGDIAAELAADLFSS